LVKGTGSNFKFGYPVEKVHGCAQRFMADFDYRGRELIYSDPPYLHHTRSSKQRYRFDYEEQDHIQLLELLKSHATSCCRLSLWCV
jgi:hypothetical protein